MLSVLGSDTMPELRVPITSELLSLIKAHHRKRLDCPSLPAMVREYILRTIREEERSESDRARRDRQERARLAKLERKAAQARTEAAREERERARAERKAARAQVPTWNGTAAGPEPPPQA